MDSTIATINLALPKISSPAIVERLARSHTRKTMALRDPIVSPKRADGHPINTGGVWRP